MKSLKKYIGNKKGASLLEYYIILIVGLIVLSGLMIFMQNGEQLIKNVSNKYSDMGVEPGKNAQLGSFVK